MSEVIIFKRTDFALSCSNRTNGRKFEQDDSKLICIKSENNQLCSYLALLNPSSQLANQKPCVLA